MIYVLETFNVHDLLKTLTDLAALHTDKSMSSDCAWFGCLWEIAILHARHRYSTSGSFEMAVIVFVICMYVCMYIYIYICISVHIYIYIYKNSNPIKI